MSLRYCACMFFKQICLSRFVSVLVSVLSSIWESSTFVFVAVIDSQSEWNNCGVRLLNWIRDRCLEVLLSKRS